MFSLALPFHTDIDVLLATLDILKRDSESASISEVLLCHNGPPLTAEQEIRLRESLSRKVRLLHTDAKGMGAGYRLGIRSAGAEFVILSASDLPFGLSDLRSFLDYRNRTGSFPQFAIGSKAHPDSRIGGYGLLRRLASLGFWQLRRLLLGARTPRDSQGTLIVRTKLAQTLVERCRHDNYFFSVELITRAQRSGTEVVELPVLLEHHYPASSSVSVAGDGFQMARDLICFWRSLRAEN